MDRVLGQDPIGLDVAWSLLQARASWASVALNAAVLNSPGVADVARMQIGVRC